MKTDNKLISNILWIFFITFFTYTYLKNYILFHTSIEFFMITISCSIFLLMYNARKYVDKSYLIIISVGYLFVSFFDILHVISYEGILNYEVNQNYYLFIRLVGRMIESLTFFFAAYFLKRVKKVSYNHVFLSGLIITLLLYGVIYYTNHIPPMFNEGVGSSSIKIFFQLIIISIFLITMIILVKSKSELNQDILRYFIYANVLTILSELFFIVYIEKFGLFNAFGHVFKIMSIYFVYKAVIKVGILEPYQTIFRDLKLKEKELEEVALKDELTRVYNRRTCFKILEQLHQLHDEHYKMTVCFLDIDDLKIANDLYGHQVGDELIKTVVHTAKEHLCEGQSICRLGGDEFLIILPGVSYQEALIIINRIKYDLEKCQNGKTYKVDFSFGCHEFENSKDIDFDKIIEITDQLMYLNKNQKLTS